MKKKLSIHDIARELRVSATTVSFVLNGKAEEKKISSAMVERVMAYVEKIGYRPNLIAQSLRTGKSKIIGMLVEDISDPFFSSIARIVEENLYKLDYKIFHSSTNNKTERAKDLIQIFRERQVDGYIIAPAPGLEEEIQELLNESKPVILFDRYFPELNTTNVVIDNMGGAYNATQHLIQNGFRDIAFITLNSDQVQMADRMKGYKKSMTKNKLTQYVLRIDYNLEPEKVSEMMKTFLKKNKTIDAVFFATNYLAVGGMKVIKDMGLKVPENIGVVGFDDNSNFALFSPSITAVAQPVEEISKQTVQQLIHALPGEENVVKRNTIVLPTDLIIRESSVRLVKIKKSGTKGDNK